MKNNNTIFYLLTFLVVFLYSCEYDKDIVYIKELTPPKDSVELDIELSHVLPNNTIYIYEYTKLTYTIDSKGKDILDFKISFDGSAEIHENSIYLYPLADNSVRKLTFDVQLKTHTGSMADILGYEKYVGRYEYNIKFVKLEENFKTNLRGSKSEEGYLQLNWDTPVFDNADLVKYELIYTDDITKQQVKHEITDPKQTSFIDKNYIWGYKTYELLTYYKNKDVNYESLKSDYFSPEYYGFKSNPKFTYEYLDSEFMNVSWADTGYKCKYLIIDADGTKTECEQKQRKVKMQRFRFPSDGNRFKLYILPFDMPYSDYDKGIFIDCDSYWYNIGEYSAIPHAWNIAKNEYYNLNNGELNVFSISNSTKKNNLFLREVDGADFFNISVSDKTSQVAIYKWTLPMPISTSDLFIYENNNFTNPLRIENVTRNATPLFLCDNYTLFYSDLFWLGDTNYERSCIVLNSKTGNEIFRQVLQNRESQFTVSPDGKYLCDYYKAHLIIYEIENNKAVQIYSYTNAEYRYLTCQFNYSNPKELILGGDIETAIFDVESLTNKNSIKGKFLYQDPITGNIACMDEHYNQNFLLNIYDKTLSQKLIRVPFNYYTSGNNSFFNNRLFFNDVLAYRLDLPL